MTSAQQRMVRGETQYNRVSRFVREIPRELVDLGHTVQEHKPKIPETKSPLNSYLQMKKSFHTKAFQPQNFKVTKAVPWITVLGIRSVTLNLVLASLRIS